MSELKCCPFCGTEPELMATDLEASPLEFWVRCAKECIEQVSLYTAEDAIKHWNTRI